MPLTRRSLLQASVTTTAGLAGIAGLADQGGAAAQAGIDDADADLAKMTDVAPRTVADVYGEYVWVRTMADAVPGTLDVVSSSFEDRAR